MRKTKRKKNTKVNRPLPDEVESAADFWDLPLMPSNRFGGIQLGRLVGLRGGTYGPASKVKQYSEDERKALEAELQATGRL